MRKQSKQKKSIMDEALESILSGASSPDNVLTEIVGTMTALAVGGLLGANKDSVSDLAKSAYHYMTTPRETRDLEAAMKQQQHLAGYGQAGYSMVPHQQIYPGVPLAHQQRLMPSAFPGLTHPPMYHVPGY